MTPETKAAKYGVVAGVSAVTALFFLFINLKAGSSFLKRWSYAVMVAFLVTTMFFVICFIAEVL